LLQKTNVRSNTTSRYAAHMNTSGNALVKHPQSGRKDLTGLLHLGIPFVAPVTYGEKKLFYISFLKVLKLMSFSRLRTTTFGVKLKIGFPSKPICAPRHVVAILVFFSKNIRNPDLESVSSVT